MKFTKRELEIILIALSDFRLKNIDNPLYEDFEIKEIISKFLEQNFDEEE